MESARKQYKIYAAIGEEICDIAEDSMRTDNEYTLIRYINTLTNYINNELQEPIEEIDMTNYEMINVLIERENLFRKHIGLYNKSADEYFQIMINAFQDLGEEIETLIKAVKCLKLLGEKLEEIEKTRARVSEMGTTIDTSPGTSRAPAYEA